MRGQTRKEGMPARLRLHTLRGMLISVAVLVFFAVVALLASSDAAVAAKQPKCGDTITADTTLHHDLVNCPNNGIIIGAEDVTLDLNYHTIDGDGTEFAGCPETSSATSGCSTTVTTTSPWCTASYASSPSAW